MNKRRIGVIEDDEGFIKGICNLLEARGDCEIIFVAKDYKSGLQKIKNKPFDILFVDLGLPDGDGADLILKARRIASPEAEIYVLSCMDNGQLILNALKQGAVGFVFKNEPPKIFLQQIDNIFSGNPSFSSLVSQAIVNHLSKCADARALITEREFQIFTYNARGSSSKDISRELNITTNTVSSHAKNGYRKLGVNSIAEAINILKPE